MNSNADDVTFFPLKVLRTGPGGKRTFDPDGKRMLIEACRMPGVSISGMALKAGINANQLHKWVRAGQRPTLAAVAGESAPPAFVPVLQIASAPPQGHQRQTISLPPAPLALPVRLSARLANGVAVELECTGNDAALVKAMIAALGAR